MNTIFLVWNMITILVAALLTNVSGEDPGVPYEDYLRVFKDVPSLFEYIVEMLHERPEVLEKDDITNFLETALANDEVSKLSSSENEPITVTRMFNFADLSNDGVGQEYDGNLLKANDDFGGFVGSVGSVGSQLTADEVAEMMVKIERKLEEYNNETN